MLSADLLGTFLQAYLLRKSISNGRGCTCTNMPPVTTLHTLMVIHQSLADGSTTTGFNLPTSLQILPPALHIRLVAPA